MNVCGYIGDSSLNERLSLLAARAGWSCWLCDDPAVLNKLLESMLPPPDVIVSDDENVLNAFAAAGAAPPGTLPGPPLALLHWDTERPQDSNPPLSRIAVGRSDDDVLQALQTCVNARRLRDRFAGLERNEPITRLPHHDELFKSLTRHKGTPMGLLIVQIDHAAHLYNSLDPVSRTDLLAAIGEQIRGAIPERACLGFYDAACFLVALPGFGEAAVAGTAERLLEALRRPFGFRAGELHVTVSIGFGYEAIFSDGRRLWSATWRAMREAVETGGNRTHGTADAGLSRRLPGALERDEFSLVLQPQMTLDGRRLTGAEALLRWQGMEVGQLAPDRFIPVAEQRGHMARIGDWVLDNACREAVTWFEHLLEPLWLGINISPQQFHRSCLVERIRRYRLERWFDPAMLELELPHEAMLALVDDHRDQLYQLRDWGVRFALDNLGGSLIDAAKLLRCPVDTLKIDRAVISRLDTDPEARDLVAQICQLGQRFELRVVAVGVERDSQRSILNAFGCTDVQGYLYSPPVSLDEFKTLLRPAPALVRSGS